MPQNPTKSLLITYPSMQDFCTTNTLDISHALLMRTLLIDKFGAQNIGLATLNIKVVFRIHFGGKMHVNHKTPSQ